MDPMHKFEVQRTGKGAIERTTWTLLGRGHPGTGKSEATTSATFRNMVNVTIKRWGGFS